MVFRKRKFSGTSGSRKRFKRSFKRRRFSGRKGKRVNAYSTSGPLRRPIGYVAKKMSGRHWRSNLYRQTQHQTHYQSRFFISGANTTGVTVATGPLIVQPATMTATGGAGNPFWINAGGAVTPDTGAALPLFVNDIILRGGRISCTVSVLGDITNPVYVRMYLMRTVPVPDFTLLPAALGMMSDPDDAADVTTKTGKIIMRREGMLNDDSSSMKVDYRLSPQKIDQIRFQSNTGAQLVWLITAANIHNATTVPFNVVNGWNVSFSADAIGTT